MTASSKPRLILAGNAEQAYRFASRHGWGPRDCTYISHVNLSRGYMRPEVWLVGTYWVNPDYPEICAALWPSRPTLRSEEGRFRSFHTLMTGEERPSRRSR